MKITNLAIRDIIQFVKWKDVKRAVRYHYPTDRNTITKVKGAKSFYEGLFYHLKAMPKTKPNPKEFLEVYGGLDIDNEWYQKDNNLEKFLDDVKKGNESIYYSIHMLDKGKKNPYGEGWQNYAVSFIPWKRMANMWIGHDTLKAYTFEDIIAHFIWEITYYGDERQMKKTGDSIKKSAREIHKSIAKRAIKPKDKLNDKSKK